MEVVDKLKDRASFLQEALKAVDETRASMALSDAMGLLKSPRASSAQVAKAIEFDPKITDSLLREVNSPFYALEEPVKTVEHAVTLLGFDRVSDLLRTTTTSAMYKLAEGSYFETRGLKIHGVSVGVFAEQTAAHLGYEPLTDFFEAGMLHDLGKYVYVLKFGETFRKVMMEAQKRGMPLFQVERELLGTDHTQLGDLMAQEWGLPELVQVAIRYHHGINDQERERLTTREEMIVDVVTFANLLAHGSVKNGQTTGARLAFEQMPPPPGLITKTDLAKIQNAAEIRFSEVCKAMALVD